MLSSKRSTTIIFLRPLSRPLSFLPTTIMSTPLEDKKDAQADTRSVASSSSSTDYNKLLEIGYVPSFKREFSNVATVHSRILSR